MSIDTSSSQKVTSKYFSDRGGMDESLSNFQEKKRLAAPKSKQVDIKNKSKPKKSLKKPRGQKDIRTALKSRKSELLAFSKDFGNACMQSGIDVDPEQLQLAIALSKSIQPSTSETQTSLPSSGERSARIRTTLQEYGFTVPEIKIANNRKIKKHKKNYKLLLLSESEKQKNIADKYSQILLQNISQPRSPTKRFKCTNSCSKLFYLTTNVSYESIKDNSLYYLENLPLDKSAHKGSLLRDWSEIPGRPVSPKLTEASMMDVSEILCSQEELNIILSGALKNAKNVINRLQKSRVLKTIKDIDVEIIGVNEKCNDNNPDEVNNKSSSAQIEPVTTRSYSPDMFDDDHSGFQDLEANTSEQVLSVEDKLTSNKSIILPNSLETVRPIVSNQSKLSQKWNETKRKSNDVMELTECVGVTLNPCCSYVIRTDTTKRKTNDFMELTECVQQKDNVEENIDLTQNSDETITDKNQIEIMDLTQSSDSNEALPFVHVSGKNNESLDDTVILNVSEINVVNRSPRKEDCLTEITGEVNENQKILCKLISETTLTNKQSISVEESSNDSIFEDFLYNHSNSPEQNENSNKKSVTDAGSEDKTEIDLTQSPEYNNATLEKSAFQLENKDDSDSTQNSSVSDEVEVHNILTNEHECYYKEQSKDKYEKSISDLHIEDNTEIDLTQSPEYNNDTLEKSVAEFDSEHDTKLTQNSSESEVSNDNILAYKIESCNKSSLGKKNDVSIDYDELSTSHAMSSVNKTNIYDLSAEINSKDVESNSCSVTKSNTTNSPNKHSDNLDTTQTSQDSEVFEISDKELDYSMHKSRFDDCFEVNFGALSVIESNSDLNKDNKICDPDESRNDSFLPEVNIKRKQSINRPSDLGLSPIKLNNDNVKTPNNCKVINKNHDTAKESCIGISPIKKNDMYDIVKTPSNNEYLVKTDQVTPMGDYNTMSTPDRNNELDKYGLKPLKRKRAIQLLNHIYNQTHPIVQPCTSEVSQSPTKKRKTESIKLTSPRKTPKKIPETETENARNKNQGSPVKNNNSAISPIKTIDVNYEIKENFYEETSEKVEIKNIECAEDEWVFQKKEKSKLHSCRVPLHIAFHNYVSCRRHLQEAILRYEPIEIDVIHKDLAASGHKYDPKDLLKFLDKKCITVKTVDNSTRNTRK